MTIAFYMDVQIPRAITYGLRLRGVDVLTAQEDGYGTASDNHLLDRAMELNRVLFSQDEDFLAEATRRQSEGIAFFGVIYIHQQRTTIGRCVQDLDLIAKVAELEEFANRVEYLPL